MAFDVSGTLSRFELGNADYGPGAGTVSMYDIMTNRRTVVLEVRPVASLDAVFRITALPESEEASTEVAGIQTAWPPSRVRYSPAPLHRSPWRSPTLTLHRKG